MIKNSEKQISHVLESPTEHVVEGAEMFNRVLASVVFFFLNLKGIHGFRGNPGLPGSPGTEVKQ